MMNIGDPKYDHKEDPLGPILIETNTFEYPLDLRKLPGKYKKIYAYIARDRDTEHESEIIVKWADEIIFKTGNIRMYDEIKEKIRIKAFKLEMNGNKIEMVFTEPKELNCTEKRKSIDRRSGDDRRS